MEPAPAVSAISDDVDRRTQLESIKTESTTDDGCIGTVTSAIGLASGDTQPETIVFSRYFGTPQTINSIGATLELTSILRLMSAYRLLFRRKYVCTDAALRELVANRHCPTPLVRTAILDLARRS